MILGLHVKSQNIGDRYSCPLLYFDVEQETRIEMIHQTKGIILDFNPDMVIYGGGSIISSPNFYSWPCKTVAWGVGHHERIRPWEEKMKNAHRLAAKDFDLYFPRDAIRPFMQVPCSSCMHTVFDETHEIKHEVVRYSAERRVSVDDYSSPHMTNHDGTIEDAVRFLGSGRRIITSSYHGAYWAGLLGRNVDIVPWGSKFQYLPKMTLKESRERNISAHKKVMEALNG